MPRHKSYVPHGVIPAVILPFHDDLSIDEPSFRKHLRDVTSVEGLSAITGFGAYCATIEIHAKEGFMVRRYDINQTPNAVGRETRRWFSFQGPDRMSLRVDPSELNPPAVETMFIWERVGK